jgi:hypothetical protein
VHKAPVNGRLPHRRLAQKHAFGVRHIDNECRLNVFGRRGLAAPIAIA